MRLLGGLVLLFSFSLGAFAQNGRMLLVGGGSEKNGASGWSVPAYRWAVQGKRVAAIGNSTGSLAPYLKQYCGAAFAKEFGVATRDSADSQILYDSLMTYDVIFFRGGDQYDYYKDYKGTRLQQAAETLYQNGGTLAGTSAGMHILSSIVFTAKNGTVYPTEAIQNPNNYYMTLADDFMDFFPGYLFDTHFSERGRFARLVGFMAKYGFDHPDPIIGLGMDDMTCMTVDENKIGTVYGTGCANIYTTNLPFQLNGTKLLHPAVQVTQLTQGCTYDFNSQNFTTAPFTLDLDTQALEETGNFVVLASGANGLTANQNMLNDLVTLNGQITDPVLLLTGNETSATGFKNKILQLGAAAVDLFFMKGLLGNDAALAEKIQSAKKILFVGNSTADFNAFRLTTNGLLLQNKLLSNDMISAFVGDDARFAGKTVVDNYYTEYAAYYGELEFSKGWSLLKHSMVMPNTFSSTSMYENTASAVPYALALDTLRYGIWLTDDSYMKVQPIEGKTTLSGYGIDPLLVLRNEGGKAGFTIQTGTGSSSANPRMEAGFEQLSFSLTDYSTPYLMGNTQPSALSENKAANQLQLLSNPVTHLLQGVAPFNNFDWIIFQSNGQESKRGTHHSQGFQLETSELRAGMHIFQIRDKKTGDVHSVKFNKL